MLSSARRVRARYSPDRSGAGAWPAAGSVHQGSRARIACGRARAAVNWNAESITRLRRLFLESFSVMDVAEPLVSVDAERDAAGVRALLEERRFDLVGVRVDGLVRGYASRVELAGGRCGDHLHAFVADDLVPETGSLRDAILSLGANGRCFVTVLGQPAAIATPEDLEKPPARMFLFGMITILEALLAREVEARLPGDCWRASLAPARLARAEALLAERRRRGQPGTLLDCLQLSDKGQVLLSAVDVNDPSSPFRFTSSRKEAKRALKELEALRNNLAHTQRIVPDGWSRIVLFSSRVDALLEAAVPALGAPRQPATPSR